MPDPSKQAPFVLKPPYGRGILNWLGVLASDIAAIAAGLRTGAGAGAASRLYGDLTQAPQAYLVILGCVLIIFAFSRSSQPTGQAMVQTVGGVSAAIPATVEQARANVVPGMTRAQVETLLIQRAKRQPGGPVTAYRTPEGFLILVSYSRTLDAPESANDVVASPPGVQP